MNEREINQFLKILEKEKRAAAKHTKAQALAFLQSIGVFTKNGNPSKQYKSICIPKERT
ncbi:MAG: hypothetical protein ABI723_06655 [Bacteroidia bacterium]